MTENLEQVTIRASAEDIAVIDALAKQDGYGTRSAWIRFHLLKVINSRRDEIIAISSLRKVINSRRDEIIAISSLPHPIDGAVVPVVYVAGN